MWGRGVWYLAALTGCFGFYIIYGQWLSWLVLMAVVFLPLLGLLVSLPAMIRVKAKLYCPERVQLGNFFSLRIHIHCPVAVPPVEWHVQMWDSCGRCWRKCRTDQPIPAEHCGCLWVCSRRPWVYDYLGLFRRPLPRQEKRRILLWPREVPTELPSLQRYLSGTWKPKPGGGFSEDYELREYRPGDSLHQIHWKLAAKTGKLILREPMLPVRGRMVLSLIFGGTPEQVDEKLGKLLYSSRYLLKKELVHDICCLTGEGMQVHTVADEDTLQKAVDSILSSTLTEQTRMPEIRASWIYRIGGEEHEA